MKYSRKYAKMLLDYTDLSLGREGRLRELLSNGLPSVEKFASAIGVSVRQLKKWAEKHPELSDAMAEAVARICDVLSDAAAFKQADSTFIKYLLDTKYGAEEQTGGTSPFEINLTVVK